MSGLLPVAVYGLKVPAGDVMVPSLTHFPATVCDRSRRLPPTLPLSFDRIIDRARLTNSLVSVNNGCN